MIQQRTVLRVVDNSGAKTVRCLKVLGGSRKKVAAIGDRLVVAIRKLRNRGKSTAKVKQKEVYKALVVKTKCGIRRGSGHRTRFFTNSVVILNAQGNPVGTRILGPLPREIKSKRFQKIISISRGLV